MSLGEIQTQSDWCPQKERNVKTHRTSCGQESKHVSQEMPEMLTRPGSQESAGQVLTYPPCQHLDLGRSPAYRSKRQCISSARPTNMLTADSSTSEEHRWPHSHSGPTHLLRAFIPDLSPTLHGQVPFARQSSVHTTLPRLDHSTLPPSLCPIPQLSLSYRVKPTDLTSSPAPP